MIWLSNCRKKMVSVLLITLLCLLPVTFLSARAGGAGGKKSRSPKKSRSRNRSRSTTRRHHRSPRSHSTGTTNMPLPVVIGISGAIIAYAVVRRLRK